MAIDRPRRVGSVSQQDVLEAYAAHLLSLAPVAGRQLKVVIDAGNGMAGLTAPTVFERLGADQIEVVPMYFELDGTFPNHEANPIEPANLVDLQKRVLAESAPTSAWPSTATPTAASWSTSRARRSRPRR